MFNPRWYCAILIVVFGAAVGCSRTTDTPSPRKPAELKSVSQEAAYARLDSDGDGQLALLEFTAEDDPEGSELFRDLDLDGGGTLTLDEFRSNTRNARFWRADADEDGGLSLDEYVGTLQAGGGMGALEKFNRKDADGDGILTLKEFTLAPKEFAVGTKEGEPKRKPKSRGEDFAVVDSDGDGSLTPDEFRQSDEMEGVSSERVQKLFGLLDQNEDGQVSSQEYTTRTSETNFLMLDANEDNALSLDEFESRHRQLAKAGRSQIVFAAIDVNGDGSLSPEEFANTSKEAHFLQQDMDGDGKLTPAEFSRMAKSPEKIAEAEAAFKDKDKDGDGALTLEEFSAAEGAAEESGATNGDDFGGTPDAEVKQE